MAFKKFRKMKVYNVSGYNYKDTPTIILKGEWLKETGFENSVITAIDKTVAKDKAMSANK